MDEDDYLFSDADLAHPEVWADKHRIQVLDPDGWRNAGVDWNEEITELEFLTLLNGSTVQLMTGCTLFNDDLFKE